MSGPLYVYGPHFKAVETNLRDVLRGRNCLVHCNSLEYLRGQRSPIFVYIPNHNTRVPDEFMQGVRAIGCVVLTIDDEWARERHFADAMRKPVR